MAACCRSIDKAVVQVKPHHDSRMYCFESDRADAKEKDHLPGPQGLFSWQISRHELEELEREIILSDASNGAIDDLEVEKGTKIHYVEFPPKCLPANQTRCIPLVMLHGMGGGIAMFHRNYSTLHYNRSVYAIDLPGFGLSSRTRFPRDPVDCEREIVRLLELWRKGKKLEEFVLLGHSFGAYISAVYAMRYPTRVKHLVLVDPWGMVHMNEDVQMKRNIPCFILAVMFISKLLDLRPFSTLRTMLGPYIAKWWNPSTAYGPKMVEYFLQANGQSKPTGEDAVTYMSDYQFMWAKYPLKDRIEKELDRRIPMTFIYGRDSTFCTTTDMIECKYGRRCFHYRLPEKDSVECGRAGHHVFVEQPDLFNKCVQRVCNMVDKSIDS